MDRQLKVTLHRERAGTDQVRMIDEGSAINMVEHIVNQPRVNRSEYTIMDGATVYAASEVEKIARESAFSRERPLWIITLRYFLSAAQLGCA